MQVRIGNASAPRWYDMSERRLDEYADHLVSCGATATELVLHHGDVDDATARVHVLQDDWDRVIAAYHRRNLVCHVHAPLHPRFSLRRWQDEAVALRHEMMPILDAVADASLRQGEASTLVLHGAPGLPDETAAFLEWAARELQVRGAGGRLSLELRRPRASRDRSFDRSRRGITAFVANRGIEHLGICWDIGHDWEARFIDLDWHMQPTAEFIRLVNHVHLHDAGGADDDVHYPLQSERIPWRPMLTPLMASGFREAITLEVRYRFARAMGDPWDVLGDSYARLRAFLDPDPMSTNGPRPVAATICEDRT